MENNILVTAIGYNSVYGTGAENYWKQVQAGHSHNGPSVITDIDPQKYLNSKGQKYLNKASLIYCNIAFQCIYQRQLQDFIKANPDRVGLYDSSELSNVEACFQFDLIAKNEGPDYVSPMNSPNTIANASASQMAIQAGVKGPNFTVCSGTSGSLQAVDIASMHLNHRITDYAIVGSTEVINKYQTAIRRGEKRNPMSDSAEQGAALLLERFSDEDNTNRSKLAVLKKRTSGMQLLGESKEELLWRLITEFINTSEPIDLCIISGGGQSIDGAALNSLFEKKQFQSPIAFPEKQSGFGDNAGGILGILYAIGIFQGKISSIPVYTGSQSIDGSKMQNLLVISVDTTGNASAIMVSKPGKFNSNS
jgi:3-oxoacyl-[acyl-carrier-protein] synthase II